MSGIYWERIREIVASGRMCMANVSVSTEEGVFLVDLTDYQSVRRLGHVIAGSLDAWERGADGQWIDPPIRTKRNAMPPGGPLAVEDVDTFLAWVSEGMPESPAVA